MNQNQEKSFIDNNPVVKAAVRNIEQRKGKGHSITIDELQEEVNRIESLPAGSLILVERSVGFFFISERDGSPIGTCFSTEEDARKMSKAREMFNVLEIINKPFNRLTDEEAEFLSKGTSEIIEFVKKPKAGN